MRIKSAVIVLNIVFSALSLWSQSPPKALVPNHLNVNMIRDPGSDPDPLPAPDVTNCSYPVGSAYFGNLQGRVPTNCYGGNLNWWALPKNGGTLAVTAQACKQNIWYVSVVGEKIGFTQYEARVAGIQGLSGTPDQPTLKAPELYFNYGICSNTYSPFHGVKFSSAIPNFYTNLLQERPTSSGDYDRCMLGVYQVNFTPTMAEVGKTYQVKVTAQILVTQNEYASGASLRESGQIDWIVNITVQNGPDCSQINVNVSPDNKIIPFGGTYQFVAGVSGTSDTRVQWSTFGGGSIDQNGIYTAGNSNFNDTVKATSMVDPSKSGSASVVVRANQSPIFTSAQNRFVTFYRPPVWCAVGINPTPVDYQFIAGDPEGYNINYRLIAAPGYSLPSNITITAGGRLHWDGLFSSGFVPYETSGSYINQLIVLASDPHGGSAQYIVTLIYTQLPVPLCVKPPKGQ